MSAPASVRDFVDRLVRSVGTSVQSVVYSPLPFIEGQLLVIPVDKGQSIPDLAIAAYKCDPPKLVYHWLRYSELWQLAMPLGVGAFFTQSTGGYGGFSYWMKFKGERLWGTDVRSTIPLPEDPRAFLRSHLLESIVWTRNHTIIAHLARGSYTHLIEDLGEHVRQLAATALLLHGIWHVKREAVLHDLVRSFENPELRGIVDALGIAFPLNPFDSESKPGEEDAEELAYRAAWTYERFVACLRRYVE